jgi:hypothetical protein
MGRQAILAVSQLEEVRFDNPQTGTVGVEVLHLNTLRQRVSARHLAVPQRVECFMLLFAATLGTGLHCLARDLAVYDGTMHAATLIRQGMLTVPLARRTAAAGLCAAGVPPVRNRGGATLLKPPRRE